MADPRSGVIPRFQYAQVNSVGNDENNTHENDEDDDDSDGEDGEGDGGNESEDFDDATDNFRVSRGAHRAMDIAKLNSSTRCSSPEPNGIFPLESEDKDGSGGLVVDHARLLAELASTEIWEEVKIRSTDGTIATMTRLRDDLDWDLRNFILSDDF